MAKQPFTPGPLMFDLMGPFVVHFCKGQVRISAPLCADHFANILTDLDDIPVDGLSAPTFAGRIYALDPKLDPKRCHVAPCTISPDVLVVDQACKVPIPQQTTHLLMTAPPPDAISGLQADDIWIQRNGATAWISNPDSDNQNVASAKRARGLRFIYNKCTALPEISVDSNAVAFVAGRDRTKLDIHPTAIGADPVRYSIVLHFASNRKTLDEHNQDAISCFQTVRNLVADTANWQVLFNDSQTVAGKPERHNGSIDNVVAGHPVHCTGASLVTSDTKPTADGDGNVTIP